MYLNFGFHLLTGTGKVLLVLKQINVTGLEVKK